MAFCLRFSVRIKHGPALISGAGLHRAESPIVKGALFGSNEAQRVSLANSAFRGWWPPGLVGVADQRGKAVRASHLSPDGVVTLGAYRKDVSTYPAGCR